MKTTKNLFSTFLVFCACFSFSTVEAQWTRTSPNLFVTTLTDNVGIGVTAPTQKLEVAGSVKAGSALIGNSVFGATYSCFRNSSCTTTGNYALLQDNSGSTYLNAATGQSIYFRNNNVLDKMTITATGVGIGTKTPSYPLHVVGNSYFDGHLYVPNTRRIICGTGYSHGLNIFFSEDFLTSYIDYMPGNLYFRTSSGGTATLVLQQNGCVGIGMGPKYDAPGYDHAQGYKLAVNGSIICEEVKVVSSVPSSDYVFDAEYKLLTLQEVESFVKENKHLPEVPSAQEFKENGYKVGEMDDLLLRKVEELTLYVIEQNKRIEALEKENQLLKGKSN